MKPGIYLIEVKECGACNGSKLTGATYNGENLRLERYCGQTHTIPVDNVESIKMCPHCNGLGYTETRIEAEAWLLDQLRKNEIEKLNDEITAACGRVLR